MPILNLNILGSKIEINYQESEKKKLLYLVDQFNLRLSEFENLKGRYSDDKILFLAALKAEDNIHELIKKIDKQNKKIDSIKLRQNHIDNNIKEIVILKDEIALLKKENIELEKEKKDIVSLIKNINVKFSSLIKKIVNNIDMKNND